MATRATATERNEQRSSEDTEEHGLNYRISKARRAVIIPYDGRVTQTIPHAKELVKNGKRFHVVPHKRIETQLLNNFGYDIPAPILHHYDWVGTTPFDSQKVTAQLMSTKPRAYILNDMGTGKTRASLYACDYLKKHEDVNKVLVVAPLSTLTTVWEREIFMHFPHLSAVSLHGTRSKRLKLLAMDHDFYIINHDGVSVIADALINRRDINTVIIDELALLRNAKTKRWKVLNKLVQSKKYAWGLTGAPTPKAPIDAYGQVKLLTPHRVPRFFTEFRDQTMYQITQFKWGVRKNAHEVVHKVMQPSVRFKRSDCLDLPPTTCSTYECELSVEQAKAYKEMLETCKTQVIAARAAGVSNVTAVNSGVQFGKLIQIASGFVYGAWENGHQSIGAYDDKPRYNLLTEIIDETERKVIVFAPFKYLVEDLAARLRGGGESAAFIHGDTSKADRDKAFIGFQNSSSPRIIIAQPATMSHGLTLTEANTIVWYAPVFSLETYEQANARITRPGQKYNTHIVHIQATPIEKRVYNTLRTRGNMQKALLELFDSI